MSLRDPFQKMSKSDNIELSRINLNDSPDLIKKKVRKAVTDCTSEITFSPEERPGVSNLVSIYSAITVLSPTDVAEQFVGKETVDFKHSLAEVIIEHLKPIQQKLAQYNASPEYVDDILRKGSEKATEEACRTMADVKTVLGLQ